MPRKQRKVIEHLLVENRCLGFFSSKCVSLFDRSGISGECDDDRLGSGSDIVCGFGCNGHEHLGFAVVGDCPSFRVVLGDH